jgi:hypothetical protein
MLLKASITIFPFTLYRGSITNATALGFNYSKLYYVETSTPDNQHPNPGCE